MEINKILNINYFLNKKNSLLLVFKNSFLITMLLLTILSCSKNPVEPKEDPPTPGSRDYVWTIDTLAGFNNPRYRMWGSSPSNIWTTSPGDWDKSLSHFNGEEWNSFGINGINAPTAIYGFNKSNVFLGTQKGQIWQYNGTSWSLFAELVKGENDRIYISNIWGESPENFYAFGAFPDSNGLANGSVIAHYTNKKLIILPTENISGNVTTLYKSKNDENIYIRVLKIGGDNHQDSSLIYVHKNGKNYRLYNSVWAMGFEANISLINDEVYFIFGNKIAKRINDKFYYFLTVNSANFYQRIWGRNSYDIFLLMTDGLVHFNGTDLEYLFYFNVTPRTQIYGVALFEKKVFFLVYEAQTGLSLVYHGTLK